MPFLLDHLMVASQWPTSQRLSFARGVIAKLRMSCPFGTHCYCYNDKRRHQLRLIDALCMIEKML